MEGNQMKMRDALVFCLRIIGENGIRGNVFIDDIREAHRAITAALAAPPRNCDVGTAAEQKERFDAFCNARSQKRYCCDCILQKNRQGLCEGLCEFAWAQMPYEAEEGGPE